MCGICGVVNFSGQPIEKKVLVKMASTLAHRGPDAEGFYTNDQQGHNAQVGLAHRRLSIIDITTGQQPLSNEDDSVWIVFNGEIYNYMEIRSTLISKGHVFKTNSDTETIVHAYEHWGQSCVEKLRGMFAFAIWDCEKEELFLGRDRLGIKPLYYHWDGHVFVFASEIKAILEHPNVKREVNLEAVSDYFSLLYIPAPKSIFKNVSKLEAGYTLSLNFKNTLKIRQYWDLSFDPNHVLTEGEWKNRLVTKLEEAISIRLMSEVPLGAFLSGGIDSSAVVALMSGLMSEPVKTTAIGFKEDTFNELPFARDVANQYKTDHFEQTVTPESLSVLDGLSWLYDEPFADSSAVPTYYVSGAAKEKVTVCLSGDGGDENFAGYRRHYFDLLENKIRGVMPVSFRQNVIRPIASLYPKLDWAHQVFRAKTLLTNLSIDPVEGYFNSMSFFQDVREDLLVQHQELRDYSALDIFKRHYKNAPKDPLSAIQYIDVKTYLVDDILTKVDRASMAHSLEVRVPLLDHEFMELVATIPSSLKLKGKEGKYIFKKSLQPLLSQETLYRKKKGFSMPISHWFKAELKPMFEELVLGKRSRAQNLLNPKTISLLWKQHQSGVRKRGTELWAILMLEKWMRTWHV